MAGHNKWSKIKRTKGALDVKRGKIFSRLFKEITVAGRHGGGNPASHPRLRAAISAPRAESMPNENTDRALEKRSGELETPAVEELSDEGHVPGVVAFLFHRNGQMAAAAIHENRLLKLILDADAEALETAGIEPASPKLPLIAQTAIAITDETTAAPTLTFPKPRSRNCRPPDAVRVSPARHPEPTDTFI